MHRPTDGGHNDPTNGG